MYKFELFEFCDSVFDTVFPHNSIEYWMIVLLSIINKNTGKVLGKFGVL